MTELSTETQKPTRRSSSFALGVLVLLMLSATCLWYSFTLWTSIQHNSLAQSEYRKLKSALNQLDRKRQLPSQIVFYNSLNTQELANMIATPIHSDIQANFFYSRMQSATKPTTRIMFLDLKHKQENTVFRLRVIDGKELEFSEPLFTKEL